MNHLAATPHEPSRATKRRVGTSPTAGQIRALLDLANITQTHAATLCHAGRRSLQQWLSGDHDMPPPSAELLAMAIVAHGLAKPGPWLDEWLRPELAALARRGAP